MPHAGGAPGNVAPVDAPARDAVPPARQRPKGALRLARVPRSGVWTAATRRRVRRTTHQLGMSCEASPQISAPALVTTHQRQLTGTCKLFGMPGIGTQWPSGSLSLREHDTTCSRRRAGAGVGREHQRHHTELPDLAAPESLIGESSSACGHELSFERLLHEAVHGIAAARGVRDTSRAGRYHNRRFLAIAEELGLDHPEEPHPSSGFSLVTLTPEAKRRYRPTIERLQRALKAHTVATATDTARSFRGPAARHGSSGGGCASRRSATAGATSASSRRCWPRPRSCAAAAASRSGSRRWSARE
ncbi:hypothetical protein SMICM17S_05177 [Streptomyces microflavus]